MALKQTNKKLNCCKTHHATFFIAFYFSVFNALSLLDQEGKWFYTKYSLDFLEGNNYYRNDLQNMLI